jgi:hypothetical protein
MDTNVTNKTWNPPMAMEKSSLPLQHTGKYRPHVQLIVHGLLSITTKYTQSTNFIFFKPPPREIICQGVIFNFSRTTVDKVGKWMLAGHAIFNMFAAVFGLPIIWILSSLMKNQCLKHACMVHLILACLTLVY